VLKAYITEQKGQILDQEIKDVIYRVSKKINEKTRPDELDTLLTQEYFDLKQKLANELRNRFIKNYIKMEIDNLNLLIWVRAKRIGLSKEKLNEKLIRGGHADIKRMTQLYPEETRGLKSFVNANFDMKVTEAFEIFCEDNNLFKLEKEVEDYKIRYARQAKRFSYGSEVIFAYYLAKQNAIQNIRIILTGKMNNLPKEEIKKTLREVY
jgi:V/A-type H+-transporting ATPase subunit C